MNSIQTINQENMSHWLEKNKMKMFASRSSLEEAMEYAISILDESSHGSVVTALCVYHNTLINKIQDQL